MEPQHYHTLSIYRAYTKWIQMAISKQTCIHYIQFYIIKQVRSSLSKKAQIPDPSKYMRTGCFVMFCLFWCTACKQCAVRNHFFSSSERRVESQGSFIWCSATVVTSWSLKIRNSCDTSATWMDDRALYRWHLRKFKGSVGTVGT